MIRISVIVFVFIFSCFSVQCQTESEELISRALSALNLDEIDDNWIEEVELIVETSLFQENEVETSSKRLKLIYGKEIQLVRLDFFDVLKLNGSSFRIDHIQKRIMVTDEVSIGNDQFLNQLINLWDEWQIVEDNDSGEMRHFVLSPKGTKAPDFLNEVELYLKPNGDFFKSILYFDYGDQELIVSYQLVSRSKLDHLPPCVLKMIEGVEASSEVAIDFENYEVTDLRN